MAGHQKKDKKMPLLKQTTLSHMYSVKIYTCLHCHVCIKGEVNYIKHIENCSNFKCRVCKKTFKSEINFDKHHKNCPPKRFMCDICKKTYSRKADVDKHKKGHVTPCLSFVCHWCGVAFMMGKLLNLHIQQKHPDVAHNSDSFN